MPFDPSKPFEQSGSAKRKFDPSKPFDSPKPRQMPPPGDVSDPLSVKVLDVIGNQLQMASDAVIAGVDSLPGMGFLKQGQAAIAAPLKGQSFDETIRGYNKDIDDRWKRNPVAAGTGTVAFNLATPGGGATALERVASNTVASGLDQGLRSEDGGFDIGRAAQGSAAGGITSGLMEAAGPGIKALGRGYARLMAGIKGKDIDAYRANAPAINKLDVEEAGRELGDDITSVRDAAKTEKDYLDSEVSDIKTMMTGEIQDRNAAFDRNRFDKKTDFQSRQEQGYRAAKDAEETSLGEIQGRKESLKATSSKEAERLQRSAADDFIASLNPSRKAVSQASSDSYDQLDKSNIKIPLSLLKREFTKKMKSLELDGVAPPNSESYKKLQSYRSWLNNFAKKDLTGNDMKSIQSMFEEELGQIRAKKGIPGSYTSPEEKTLLSLQRDMGASLKNRDPIYKGLVAKTAQKADALNRTTEKFTGDADSVYGQFGRLSDTSKETGRGQLSKYEEVFGGDYLSRLDEAQNIRGQDFDAMFAPEVQAAKGARRSSEDALSQEKSSFDRQLFDEGQAQDKIVQEARRDQGSARAFFKDRYDDVKNRLQSVQGLNPDTSVDTMRRYGRNPETRYAIGDKLAALGETQGKGADYYPQMAKNLAVKDKFDGEFRNGSREVNLAAMMGNAGAAVAKMGGSGPGVATAIGGVIGGAGNLIGPKTVRKIIDVVDSPAGKTWANVYRKAAEKGPQEVALTHAMLMRNNPEYRRLIGEDEQ